MQRNWRLTPLLLMGAAAGLIGLGAALGQSEAVMAKAIRICLECVGIG